MSELFEWEPVWPPGPLPGPLPGSARRVEVDGDVVVVDDLRVELRSAVMRIERREEEGRAGRAERRVLVLRFGHRSELIDLTPGIGAFARPEALEAAVRAYVDVEELPLRRLHPLQRRSARRAIGAAVVLAAAGTLAATVADRI